MKGSGPADKTAKASYEEATSRPLVHVTSEKRGSSDVGS